MPKFRKNRIKWMSCKKLWGNWKIQARLELQENFRKEKRISQKMMNGFKICSNNTQLTAKEAFNLSPRTRHILRQAKVSSTSGTFLEPKIQITYGTTLTLPGRNTISMVRTKSILQRPTRCWKRSEIHAKQSRPSISFSNENGRLRRFGMGI